MRLSTTAQAALSVLALALLVPARGRAQDPEGADAEGLDAEAGPIDVAAQGFPVAFYDRPLTIADSMIRVDGELILSHDLPLAEGSLPGPGEHVFSGLPLGAAFGVTDDVEVGVSGYRMSGHRARQYPALGGTTQGLLPFVFNPDFDFGDARIYGRARVVRDPSFELALEASFAIPIDSWFALHAGVPFRARLAPRFLIDASLELLLEFGRPVPDPIGVDDEETAISMLVPVRGVLQLVPELWIAGQSGFDFYDFDIDLFVLPLSGEVGWTIARGDAPIVDLVLGVHFPFFLAPGSDGDKLPAQLWQITLGANGYFQL